METFEDDRNQFDQCFINFIRDTYIIPPPVKPSTLSNATPRDCLLPMLDILQKLFPQGRGFFIDSGANDGEYNSNTIFLERDHQWTGILIEPDKKAFKKLKSKGRNSIISNLCISTKENSKTMKWYENARYSDLNALWDRKEFGKTVEKTIQCVPVYSILKAINVTTIDFFSLDIEGMELEVLKTIPFDKIHIKVLQVEHWFIPGGLEDLKTFLATKKFLFIREILDPTTKDSLFVHEDYMHKLT